MYRVGWAAKRQRTGLGSMSATSDRVQRPLPFIESHNEGYWAAAREHKLKLQVCLHCGVNRHPPTPGCWRCGSPEWHWQEVGQPIRGVVESYVIVYRAFVRGFEQDVPYTVALAALLNCREVRLLGGVVNAEPGNLEIEIGMEVELVWDQRSSGLSLPQWSIVETSVTN